MKIILIQDYTQNLLAVTVVLTLNISGIPDFVYFTVEAYIPMKFNVHRGALLKGSLATYP